MMTTDTQHIHQILVRLYGETIGTDAYDRLQPHLGQSSTATPVLQLSERDVMLITYGDQVRRSGEKPLATLHEFLNKTLSPVINNVHILPFYPYSSDDGFSVIDYRAVDPELGTWEDVAALSQDFNLMFDAVFNHISSQSAWFQAFLRDKAPYNQYFITVAPDTDLSDVVRPRALPLLTPFQTANGEVFVWTTFSDDQIDLNYANPQVLLEMIDLLLFYVDRGAEIIRLDAIAYLWKNIGTNCLHLPQTHAVVKLFRAVLDMAAPGVSLITETNVPHDENISYFGEYDTATWQTNEAQMVYQFPLPPLILHTLHTGSAQALTQWASTIHRSSERTTFFNFAASHDGIGLRPVTSILADTEIEALVQLALDHGGYVSYKANRDGSQSPYELNINYFDAITDPAVTAETPEISWQRFLCSQAILLAFIGVPGIYFHSLFGSRSNYEGVRDTGRYRTINRQKLEADALESELAQPDAIRAHVYNGYMHLLRVRTNEPAFHPLGAQTVHDLDARVFALERTYGSHRVLALHNVTGEVAELALDYTGTDLVSGQEHAAGTLKLAPYQVVWLKLT
jgi:glucosylglycerate phosphorylase